MLARNRLVGFLWLHMPLAVGILFMSTQAIRSAQADVVLSHQKITDTDGGLMGPLRPDDGFGISTAWLGDLDGDGYGELAVGAHKDDDGGTNHGAVWILSLNNDGTVASEAKLSDSTTGIGGVLGQSSFGISVASLGDLDGAGSCDHALAVGANDDDDGGTNRGAVWIVFLNSDATVCDKQKISSDEGGLTGALMDEGLTLEDGDEFGQSVAWLGDLGTGAPTPRALAVGVQRDADGASFAGAVYILFLNTDGTVHSHQKISATAGDGPSLDGQDLFGISVAWLGDLGAGAPTSRALAVGALGDNDGGTNHGAVWILFLNSNGKVGATPFPWTVEH